MPVGSESSATSSQRYRSILLVVGAGEEALHAPRVASYLAARDASALRVVALEGAEPEQLASPDAVAEYVCRTAVRHASDLIVLDQLPDLGDAVPGCATRMAVMRLAPAAILALGDEARKVPKDLVLATDFSRASIKAAREALRATAPERVHLVTVAAERRVLPFGASANGTASDAATTMLFGAMVHALAIPDGVQVNCVTLTGEPAPALLEFTERAHADLVGVGRHGRHGGASTELGPIAAEVARRAPCSVFVPAGGERADRLTVA